ncbi:hypothetical protein CRE_14876 [Caenorhabditis remanei]|uniref:G-protein coupled receptors family 1 profile domain-containing protein n=1 Tax=Caenorhabditis remanei TaxID=31234 RepID=E3N1U7_CAERE|nr:hypothetical protein CRE_14876 [Caenorhabditis remanei]
MIALELIPLGIILLIVASIGIVGNTIMVVAFFKFKKLKSYCHLFIMLTCLADCFHNYGQLIFTVHLFGDFQTPQFICSLVNIPTLIGVISGSCWMLALGLDRFFACKWPISYRTFVGNTFYIAFQCALPVIYTSIFMLLIFMEVDSTPVTCAVPLAMGSHTFVIWSISNIVLNGITMIVVIECYLPRNAINYS